MSRTKAYVEAMIAHQAAVLGEVLAVLPSLDVRFLTWQLDPQQNTAGMLLAHMAVVQTYWTAVAATPLASQAVRYALLEEWLGIRVEDDGIPLQLGSNPPELLRTYDQSSFEALLLKGHSSFERVFSEVSETDLLAVARVDGVVRSWEWILHHVSSHTAYHFGQVCLLKQLYLRR